MSVLLAKFLVRKRPIWSVNNQPVAEQQVAYRLFVLVPNRTGGGPRRVLGGIGMTGEASVRVIVGSATVRVSSGGTTVTVVVGGATVRVVFNVVTVSAVVDGMTASVVVDEATARVIVSGLGWFRVDLLFIRT